ncbi:MAG: endonuclease III [Spirochaetaceae bacterium]|jgi:endonuclease-3|nr:endonuclease III [Spirochaetaceae bacterium]
MNSVVDWDAIVSGLETWRDGLPKNADGAPSVSTIAERYGSDAWAVLLSTVMSLRTKDKVTLAASGALLERAPDPASFLKLSTEEAERLAFPAGFYRTKIANLQKIARIILEEYDGKIPADMDSLLALPGVGRKTANLVLIEAFDMDGICVDTHVHRVCNRAGWLKSKKPDETEEILRRVLPLKFWKRINALLVLYGQQVCRPVGPRCQNCVIAEYCAFRRAERHPVTGT